MPYKKIFLFSIMTGICSTASSKFMSYQWMCHSYVVGFGAYLSVFWSGGLFIKFPGSDRSSFVMLVVFVRVGVEILFGVVSGKLLFKYCFASVGVLNIFI